jgi:hypothetical protein
MPTQLLTFPGSSPPTGKGNNCYMCTSVSSTAIIYDTSRAKNIVNRSNHHDNSGSLYCEDIPTFRMCRTCCNNIAAIIDHQHLIIPNGHGGGLPAAIRDFVSNFENKSVESRLHHWSTDRRSIPVDYESSPMVGPFGEEDSSPKGKHVVVEEEIEFYSCRTDGRQRRKTATVSLSPTPRQRVMSLR